MTTFAMEWGDGPVIAVDAWCGAVDADERHGLGTRPTTCDNCQRFRAMLNRVTIARGTPLMAIKNMEIPDD